MQLSWCRTMLFVPYKIIMVIFAYTMKLCKSCKVVDTGYVKLAELEQSALNSQSVECTSQASVMQGKMSSTGCHLHVWIMHSICCN